jgi:signal peptidase I
MNPALGNVSSNSIKPESRLRRWWPHVAALAAFCAALAIVVVGLTYLVRFRPYRVEGNSMAPTFSSGDKIFADEMYYSHHPVADGDLVVFRRGDLTLIKRVTATAGETVEIRNWVLLRNGQTLNGPYAHSSSDRQPEFRTFARKVIPAGELFVTGDNGDFSFDSRMGAQFGVVKTSDVIGKATFVYWSEHGRVGRRS